MYNLEALCKSLRITPDELHKVMAQPKYMEYAIPKKSGGFRHILAPQGKLREVQGRLVEPLQMWYASKRLSCVHGFVRTFKNQPKLGVLSNASPHVAKPYVLNMDIKNFFESISAKQVMQALMDAPYHLNEQLAKAIALLGTYEKKLPTGAPTSPVLSNMVFYRIDYALMQWVDEVNAQKSAQDVKVIYTRYADDLTFSGSENLVLEIKDRVINSITSNGFEINTQKTRAQKMYGQQWVTGVKVNEKLNVSRLYIRNLRATLHNLQTNTTDDAARKYFNWSGQQVVDEAAIAKMYGSVQSKIAWVGMVRGKTDAVYLKLRQKFSEIKKEKVK